MTGTQVVRFRGRDGLALEADQRGDPAAPVVLLLHGGGQTRHSWSGTARALAASGWRAVCLDARGHGGSDHDPGADYSLAAFADDVLHVIGQIGAVRPVLVGASLGGSTALFLEGEVAPGTAQALVLVDIVPRLEADGAQRIQAFMTGRPHGFADLAEAAEAVAAYNPHRRRPADPTGLARNLRQRADGRWYWHWDPRFITDGPSELTDHVRMVRAARSLTVPTMLVRGRASDIVSEEGAREFLDLVPHAAYADVSGAGHMVAGDRNDAFTSAVVRFLDGVRTSGGLRGA